MAFILPEKYQNLSQTEIDQRILKVREKMDDNLLILGHHYQRDEVLKHCDKKGDSFALAKDAANAAAQNIVFCGVHFMAETADIVSKENQKVFIPNPDAGCFLADCANIQQIEEIWKNLTKTTSDKIIPITYVNSSADIKAFTGKHDGIVCTSSNAEKALNKARELGDKVFFFPDQHLGRNTGVKMGLDIEKIKLWENGIGLLPEEIQEAEIILWDGYCIVHQEFSSNYIDFLRNTYDGIKIIAHPECDYSVCQKSDYTGSTKEIIEAIEASPAGSIWGVGTEKHLVNRLQKNHPDKEIYFLQEYEPKCVSMMKVTAQHLLYQLEMLEQGNEINRVIVNKEIADQAILALNRMLAL